MIVRIGGLRLPLDYGEEDLRQAAASRIKIEPRAILDYQLVRQAVDARRNKVYFNLAVDIKLPDKLLKEEQLPSTPEVKVIKPRPLKPIQPGDRPVLHLLLLVSVLSSAAFPTPLRFPLLFHPAVYSHWGQRI
jgi:hypothetical protein